MEESSLQKQRGKDVSWGRKARLIMGWFNIAFAVWLLGYSIYLLVIGSLAQNPLLPICSPLLFMGGGTLLRSKPDDSLKRMK